ncbi:Pentatricopeptide repeat-containing protein [Artemisia annua]|uniref:Pentatricopeptide repeat-containing protein n=1 Tax=Artemisia annua TaxID=35608 RepID=A0A2U1QIT6_ARTAN|nr:Pentatricopeptide repeat-containing protein [Artemisia annua]
MVLEPSRTGAIPKEPRTKNMEKVEPRTVPSSSRKSGSMLQCSHFSLHMLSDILWVLRLAAVFAVTKRKLMDATVIWTAQFVRVAPSSYKVHMQTRCDKSVDATSVELFYHDMIRWGFPPNTVTYDIRIDSYSKQGRFEDGLSHLTEMEHMNYVPTLQTITTLIHGAGISHNTTKAQKLFDEIRDRNLLPDSGVYCINKHLYQIRNCYVSNSSYK